MSEKARRDRGLLTAVLAVSAFALLAGAPSIATAETKVKTVPAEIVAQWKFNPTNDLQCGALGFVKWKDPPLKPEAIPIAWEIFYTVKPTGEERSASATPPFDDSFTWVGAEYLVGGGAHWEMFAYGSRVGAGTDEQGCSDMTDYYEATFHRPRVEITIDLKEPPVDRKKCKAARAELRERNKAVGKLLGKLRRADSNDAKNRIRERLRKAKDKRADAAQKVDKVCT